MTAKEAALNDAALALKVLDALPRGMEQAIAVACVTAMRDSVAMIEETKRPRRHPNENAAGLQATGITLAMLAGEEPRK